MHNDTLGQTGVFNLIENQQELGEYNFGTKKESDLGFSGCGIIAVYNLIVSLEEKPSTTISDLIDIFEKRGAVLWGGFGVSAVTIFHYLKKRYGEAGRLFGFNRDRIKAFGDRYDGFIVTVWNDNRAIGKGLHTVCITKSDKGFAAHNIYRRSSSGKWIASDHCDTLYSAIMSISEYEKPVMIIGVKRIKRTEGLL